MGSLTFEEPDAEAFPCLRLAREALLADRAVGAGTPGFGPACVALNAANEAAVELFLNDGCGFTDIPALVSATLDALPELAGKADLGPLAPGSLPAAPLDEARAARVALELAARVDALDAACRALVRRRAAHSEEPKC